MKDNYVATHNPYMIAKQLFRQEPDSSKTVEVEGKIFDECEYHELPYPNENPGEGRSVTARLTFSYTSREQFEIQHRFLFDLKHLEAWQIEDQAGQIIAEGNAEQLLNKIHTLHSAEKNMMLLQAETHAELENFVIAGTDFTVPNEDGKTIYDLAAERFDLDLLRNLKALETQPSVEIPDLFERGSDGKNWFDRIQEGYNDYFFNLGVIERDIEPAKLSELIANTDPEFSEYCLVPDGFQNLHPMTEITATCESVPHDRQFNADFVVFKNIANSRAVIVSTDKLDRIPDVGEKVTLQFSKNLTCYVKDVATKERGIAD